MKVVLYRSDLISKRLFQLLLMSLSFICEKFFDLKAVFGFTINLCMCFVHILCFNVWLTRIIHFFSPSVRAGTATSVRIDRKNEKLSNIFAEL